MKSPGCIWYFDPKRRPDGRLTVRFCDRQIAVTKKGEDASVFCPVHRARVQTLHRREGWPE